MFLLFPVWNISCVKSQNSRTQWGLNLDQFRESSVNTEPRREVGTDCIGDEPHLWWQIHKRMGTFSITMCMLGGCEGTNGRKQMCADTSWKGPCSHQRCVLGWLVIIFGPHIQTVGRGSCFLFWWSPSLTVPLRERFVCRSCKRDKERCGGKGRNGIFRNRRERRRLEQEDAKANGVMWTQEMISRNQRCEESLLITMRRLASAF